MSIYNTIKEIYNDTSKITGNVNADWKIVGLLKKIFVYQKTKTALNILSFVCFSLKFV